MHPSSLDVLKPRNISYSTKKVFPADMIPLPIDSRSIVNWRRGGFKRKSTSTFMLTCNGTYLRPQRTAAPRSNVLTEYFSSNGDLYYSFDDMMFQCTQYWEAQQYSYLLQLEKGKVLYGTAAIGYTNMMGSFPDIMYKYFFVGGVNKWADVYKPVKLLHVSFKSWIGRYTNSEACNFCEGVSSSLPFSDTEKSVEELIAIYGHGNVIVSN